ncbi:MAG: hypothetical protein GX595_14205 [Lentisphaerae bacterium]|nr:hypothetical protein [Lentisphaerota bacterium]
MNPITITLPATGAALTPLSVAGQAALYDTVPVTVTGRAWDSGHTYLAILSAHDAHLGGTDVITVTADAETGALTWSFDLAFTSAALIAACTGPRLRVTLSLWDAVAGRHVCRVPLDVQYSPEPAGFVPSDPSITPATAGQIETAIAAAGLGTGDVSGPASSTDGGLVAFDGITGKVLKAGPAIGTTAGTVAAGDDARLSDARTPTAHASTHASGGADHVTPAAIGAETAGAVSTHNGAADAHPFSAADRYRYGGTAGATTEGTITAAGRAILDGADAAAQRETLSAYRDQTPAAAAEVSGAAVAPDFAAALTLQWTLTGNVTSLATATGLASGETGEILATIGSYALPADPPSGAYKGAWTVTGTRVRIIIEQVGTAQYWTADSLEVVA